DAAQPRWGDRREYRREARQDEQRTTSGTNYGRRRRETMPRLPIPSDVEGFPEETRAAVRHILQTRKSMPPPSSYLTYAGRAGALLSDLVDQLRYHTSLTHAETELAICTAARAANADYVWNAHVRLGLQA